MKKIIIKRKNKEEEKNFVHGLLGLKARPSIDIPVLKEVALSIELRHHKIRQQTN